MSSRTTIRSRRPVVSILAATLATQLAAQTYTVAPSQYLNTDATHQTGIPGVVDRRVQILIGPSHLTAMVGRYIHAVELRRNATNDAFAGGQVDVSVTLSIAPHGPLDCKAAFDDNVGPNPVTAHDGTVSVPTSPATAGPNITWDPSNVVRIDLSTPPQAATPFLYTGGTLCIDIEGHPVTGQEVDWWTSDAAYQHHPGTINDLGNGCGGLGGGGSNWSSVEKHSLVVGGHAQMTAFGTPMGLAIAAIGPKAVPLPLPPVFGPPACTLQVFPLIILVPTLFIPDPNPAFNTNGGKADALIKIPNIAGAQGLTLTTQWYDWSQQATSNAIEWTVAPAIPTLDMATIEGHPNAIQGNATVHIAPVIRIEHSATL
tara:strand:- start:19505 stop:20620 length:1116 start_codon:yes stop_codon:yes gene_type:complete